MVLRDASASKNRLRKKNSESLGLSVKVLYKVTYETYYDAKHSEKKLTQLILQ